MSNGKDLELIPALGAAMIGIAGAGLLLSQLNVVTQAETPPTLYPILDLRFDQIADGYVLDYSPYGHHAKVEGTPELLAAGGMEFRSLRGDHLIIPNDVSLNPEEITLEMVVRPRTLTPEANPTWSNSVVIGKFHDQYELVWDSNSRFSFIITDMVGNFRWARSRTSIEMGNLYHVIGSYGLERPLRIMLDGNFEYGYGQDASKTGYGIRKENSDLRIGDHGDSKFIDGTLYLIRAWPLCLSDDDMYAAFLNAASLVPGVRKALANWPAT